MPVIQNQHSFKAAIEEGFNLFVGPGFSSLAQDSAGRALPSDQELARELVNFFSLPQSLASDISQVITVVEVLKRDELRQYLINRFMVCSFDERYKILDKLPLKTLFTLTIDNLFYKIFENSKTSYINDLSVNGPAFRDKRAIDLMSMHISIDDNRSQFRFGSSAITSMVISDSDRWNVITGLLQRAKLW